MRAVPDKKEFINHVLLCLIAFGLGYWVGLPDKAGTVLPDDPLETAEWKIVCAKCTARISASCNAAVTHKGKDGKAVSYLLAGKLVKGKGCEGIAHGKICKPGSGVTVTITGKVEDGKFIATKIVAKKK